jgi:signal transduction histidine kinase
VGLWLSISASIVAEQGGRIWVQNNGGPGVTFIVELPVSA